MASYFKRLDITPDLLDLGTMVVRLNQITSVGRAERRPLRWLGVVLMVVAVLLIGFEAIFNLMAFSLKTKGSVKIWAACGAAGIGLFSLVYAQRCLAITLTGGNRIMLRVSGQAFSDQLLDELRRAMRAKPGAGYHVVADLVAEKITEQHDDEASVPALALPHLSGPGHDRGMPGSQPLRASNGSGANGAPYGMPPGANGAIAYADPAVVAYPEFLPHIGGRMPPGASAGANGAMAPAGHGPAPHYGGPPRSAAMPMPYGAPPSGSQSRGQFPVNGAAPGPREHMVAMPPTFAAPAVGPGIGPGSANGMGAPRPAMPSGNRELAQLIDFIVRSEIQHKDALLELLRVVEDHELGGRTSRDEALAHWQSFSEYVVQYLAGVDGLPLLTAQAARSLIRHG
ncbi:MAG: DUF6232 family protein [Hyphomicrobiaceae bacterium]